MNSCSRYLFCSVLDLVTASLKGHSQLTRAQVVAGIVSSCSCLCSMLHAERPTQASPKSVEIHAILPSNLVQLLNDPMFAAIRMQRPRMMARDRLDCMTAWGPHTTCSADKTACPLVLMAMSLLSWQTRPQISLCFQLRRSCHHAVHLMR